MSYKIVCENCEKEVWDRGARLFGWWDVATGGKEFDLCSSECLKAWAAGLPPSSRGVRATEEYLHGC